MSSNFVNLKRGLTLGKLSSDPLDGENGDIYYNTTNNKFRKFQNGVWEDMDRLGGASTAMQYLDSEVLVDSRNIPTSGSTLISIPLPNTIFNNINPAKVMLMVKARLPNSTDLRQFLAWDPAIGNATVESILFGVSSDDTDQAGQGRIHMSQHFIINYNPALNAFFDGQVLGMTTDVRIEADNAGLAGNSITLAFNGTDNINTVLATWNLANPGNTATLISGFGSQVPNNLQTINLAGGVNAIKQIRVASSRSGGTLEFRLYVIGFQQDFLGF